METPSNSPDSILSLSKDGSLTADGQRLLQRMLDAMAALEPQPGALGDLPQVAVEPQLLAQACRIAKETPGIEAKQLLCLACVDYSDHFQLVYFVRALKDMGEPRPTMVIKGDVPYDQPRAPSVTGVWRAAEWYEREAHDLFGVTFDGHPDLSPLLLYDGFEGYPGRKEFPLNEYQEF